MRVNGIDLKASLPESLSNRTYPKVGVGVGDRGGGRGGLKDRNMISGRIKILGTLTTKQFKLAE